MSATRYPKKHLKSFRLGGITRYSFAEEVRPMVEEDIYSLDAFIVVANETSTVKLPHISSRRVQWAMPEDKTGHFTWLKYEKKTPTGKNPKYNEMLYFYCRDLPHGRGGGGPKVIIPESVKHGRVFHGERVTFNVMGTPIHIDNPREILDYKEEESYSEYSMPTTFGEIYFQSGVPGKARIIYWVDHVCHVMRCKVIGGGLQLWKIERVDSHGVKHVLWKM